MQYVTKIWAGLKNDRRAVTALEYGLIAAVIAVVIIGAVSSLGTTVKNTFTAVATGMNSATAAK